MDFETLAESIKKASTEIADSHVQNETLLDAARSLVASLESPRDAVLKMSKWNGSMKHVSGATLRSALKMKIFESFGSADIMTLDQLAIRTGADELLLARIMRAMAGIGLFVHVKENTYSHNALSKTLMDVTFRNLVNGWAEGAVRVSQLPEFLASINFQNPDDPEKSLFHYAFQTDLNVFQYMQTKPEMMVTFSDAMAASVELQGRSLPKSIAALFPAPVMSTFDVAPEEKEQTLIVDIGGGRGKLLELVRQLRPDLQGRMVVQDLIAEISGREASDAVEGMVFDFFQPQVVKGELILTSAWQRLQTILGEYAESKMANCCPIGALIYFFRHILHDWPDETCRKILLNTLSAMVRGHSRIIIVDFVLPDVGASTIPVLLDINMMVIGGMERTEKQWHTLLGSVGLEIVDIKGPEPGSWSFDSIIEAVARE